MHHCNTRHPFSRYYRDLFDARLGDLAFAACGPTGTRRQLRREFEDRIWRSRRHYDEELYGARGLGRRPLRVLTHRLELSNDQIAEAAKILERLKIERAQAEVDLRRAAADLADAVESSEFEISRAEGARDRRLEAARLVQEAVTRTLRDLHGLLDDPQRRQLAALVRSGGIRF